MNEETLSYMKNCYKDVLKRWKETGDKYYLYELEYWKNKYKKAKADKQTKEQEKWKLIENK